MAVINIDDVYILDETGAEVDKVTGLFTKNENATTGEKQMARLNIAAGGSNRNLLDNWYFVGGGSQLGNGIFPINQRGQTSYAANGYGIDRWLCYGGAITIEADGLSVPANGVLTQPTENRLTQLNGETLTMSVLYDTGIETGTAVLDLSGNTLFINNGSTGQSYITSGGLVQTYKGTASKIRAIKLEKSTVSTLANDVPPAFDAVLRKCQEYLYIPTFPWYAWTGTLAMATSATDFNWVINTPVPMRKGAIPTIGITGSVYINNTAASNLNIVNEPVGNLVKISGTSAGMTSGQLYPVNTYADNVSVILSAEPQ